MRILAIADERDPSLTARRLREIRPDVLVSCGDLEADYLDYVSSAANASLVFVPGNHDPDFRRQPATPSARAAHRVPVYRFFRERSFDRLSHLARRIEDHVAQ